MDQLFQGIFEGPQLAAEMDLYQHGYQKSKRIRQARKTVILEIETHEFTAHSRYSYHDDT